LLAQIRSAQADIDQLLAQLGGDAGTVLADAQSQRRLLINLEQNLVSGAAAATSSIRNEIAGAAAVAVTLGQQARASGDQRANVELAAAQARTRATVLEIGRDIYERRIFDPYLRFASEEDEAAYRRREEENRRAIERALAENTPEGDLRASRIMERQLQDAGAHGADASPQFAEYAARIRSDQGSLEQAMASRDEARSDGPQAGTSSPATPPPATEDQLASVLATFRAVGINGGIPAHDSGHGLSVDGSAPSNGTLGR
jgi:hypothetical protein